MRWFEWNDEPGKEVRGGGAGRGPGRGGVRGFTFWGRSSGGIGRDRSPQERTRSARDKADRGPTRGWSRTGRSRGGPR